MNLAELSWPRIQQLAPDTPIVFPIAAVEQHGHHLPVVTDSLLLGEIIRRVSARLDKTVLFAPLQWLGNSDHHLDFAGTVSASPRTYLDLLCGLAENMIAHGFRRIVLVNGHGGNDIPGKQALFEVRQKYRHRSDLLLVFTTYWGLGTQPWLRDPAISQREMGHACEWETSMVLRAAPHLVGDYQNAPVVEPGNPFLPGYRAWITKDRTGPGHIGQPHLASAEKGELLFEMFSNDVTTWLERIVNWDGQSWEG
ncbi:MAG: creatininase family protein [Gemmataceae bacterium]